MTLKFNPFTNRLDITSTGGGGGGDVSGPGSSTDNAIVRWDGASGTLIQNSVATLSDTGDILANSIDLTVPLDELDGGTAQSSYTTGDILYASGVNTLAKLAAGADGEVLTLASGVPSWAAAAGGGVTSVSGTANRITSTGGATPVIDISGSYVGQASITTLGTITTGVWTGTTIAVANGGTGATTLTGVLTGNGAGAVTANAITQYGVVIGGASNAVASTAVGSAGQVLQSSGAGVNPAYSTATFPSTATGTGKVLIADGTNWVASTPTFPNASATSGKFIRSDGTNWIASTPTLPTSAGTSGKILQSDGTNYVESTPTYPSSSGSSGKILRSDGTNNVYSTATFPDTATGTGTVLRADGTNWVASTATYPDTATAGTMLYANASNVFSGLTLSTRPGSMPIYDGANIVEYNPSKHIIMFDDFIGLNAGTVLNWGQNTANSATYVINFNPNTANPGLAELRLGTTASGGVVNRLGTTTDGSIILAGGSYWIEFVIALSALSDATDTYTARMGLFLASATTTTPTNGVYFEYTHGTNSGQWQGICMSASTPSTANSTVAATTNFTNFAIKINAAATSVSFYINGTEISNSPLSSNIPTTELAPNFQMIRTAGTSNSRSMYLDQFYMFINLTSAR